jgi:hypothetical protein
VLFAIPRPVLCRASPLIEFDEAVGLISNPGGKTNVLLPGRQ